MNHWRRWLGRFSKEIPLFTLFFIIPVIIFLISMSGSEEIYYTLFLIPWVVIGVPVLMLFFKITLPLLQNYNFFIGYIFYAFAGLLSGLVLLFNTMYSLPLSCLLIYIYTYILVRRKLLRE